MSTFDRKYRQLLKEQVNGVEDLQQEDSQLEKAVKKTEYYLQDKGFVFRRKTMQSEPINSFLYVWDKEHGSVKVEVTIEHSKKTDGIEAHSRVFISTYQVFHSSRDVKTNYGDSSDIQNVYSVYGDAIAFLETLKNNDLEAFV